MTEAVKGWWDSLHFYVQLALKGVAMAVCVLCVGGTAAAFLDALDGAVDHQWGSVLKFALILSPFMSLGFAIAFWAISAKGLTPEQLELVRKLRKGEV